MINMHFMETPFIARRNKPTCYKRAGFSLIEMAIVLAIISLVAGGFLTVISAQDEQSKINLTKERLAKIENALLYFYAQHGRLPCVAPANAADTDAAFAIEYEDSGKACQGNPGISEADEIHDGLNEETWVGALPTRTLGLPDSFAKDGWNMRFHYVVPRRMADPDDVAADYPGTAGRNTARDIIILDKGTSTTTDRINLNEPAAYVIISAGEDKKGAFARSGIRGIACDTTLRDGENCDFDNGDSDVVFRDIPIADIDEASTNYYYDYLAWKSKSILDYEAGNITTSNSAAIPKAWVRFNAATNAITSSFNVSSVTGSGGSNTINLSTNVASTDCTAIGTAIGEIVEPGGGGVYHYESAHVLPTAFTTSSFSIDIASDDSASGAGSIAGVYGKYASPDVHVALYCE